MHNILVIDDEPLNIKLIAAFLEDYPYKITSVPNSVDALKILRNVSDFDLILLDRMLPEIDGLEFAKYLKEDPELQKIPIIMQTAAAEKSQIAEGVEAGILYYITKPYGEEELAALIETCLQIR